MTKILIIDSNDEYHNNLSKGLPAKYSLFFAKRIYEAKIIIEKESEIKAIIIDSQISGSGIKKITEFVKLIKKSFPEIFLIANSVSESDNKELINAGCIESTADARPNNVLRVLQEHNI